MSMPFSHSLSQPGKLSHLQRGREAYEHRLWAEAYTALTAADRETPLSPDDLERLAMAARLIGKEAQGADLLGRAHRGFLEHREPQRAARCAFWLGFGLLEKGEMAQASGWLARARRILEEQAGECLEQGYLLLPDALRSIIQGDCDAAAIAFARATAIGRRFADGDLVALGTHGQGRALIRLGRCHEGVALLDEAMVAVTTGEVSPIVAGDVYCSVLSGCQEIFDWQRAQEWTTALTRWCAGQPELVLYRGQCLLRHSEVLQLRGDWVDALGEAQRACERLSEPADQPGLGAAHYQLAELHRLRGELVEAEEGFRQANLHGKKPQPGLALLQLAQDEPAMALASIRLTLEQTRERRNRPRLLAAQVDIGLAAGDLDGARAAVEELTAIAADLGSPYLNALSNHAAGALRLAEGDARDALTPLRQAEALWENMGTPYETGRTRALIGQASRALGDEPGAQLELEAAASIFRRLCAAPDLGRIERLLRVPAAAPEHGLSPRETQILRLIAAGKTNRAIAAELRISEKTVARHVSNMFVKLDLSSRSAATAYAYQHDLVLPPT
jgi:DNA-binding CsgD family transcriptional regulator